MVPPDVTVETEMQCRAVQQTRQLLWLTPGNACVLCMIQGEYGEQ